MLGCRQRTGAAAGMAPNALEFLVSAVWVCAARPAGAGKGLHRALGACRAHAGALRSAGIAGASVGAHRRDGIDVLNGDANSQRVVPCEATQGLASLPGRPSRG
jgi:hypothetical protein